MIYSWLKKNRQRIEEELPRFPRRAYISPALYAQYREILPLLQRYVRGKTIDLGCGCMPFKELLSGIVGQYDTLEAVPRSEPVTFVGDIQDMSMISDASYDSAICLEVLEHVPEPGRALCEVRRILNPGGTVVLSVPHLSRLHDQPHDYYRYTNYGLNYLLKKAGFEVLEIRQKGGLFSFVGHQVSLFVLGITWGIPILKELAWFVNKWLVTYLCYGVDRWLERRGLFALGYVAVAKRSSDSEKGSASKGSSILSGI
jgi:SAM-dependent methyltransferase